MRIVESSSSSSHYFFSHTLPVLLPGIHLNIFLWFLETKCRRLTVEKLCYALKRTRDGCCVLLWRVGNTREFQAVFYDMPSLIMAMMNQRCGEYVWWCWQQQTFVLRIQDEGLCWKRRFAIIVCVWYKTVTNNIALQRRLWKQYSQNNANFR